MRLVLAIALPILFIAAAAAGVVLLERNKPEAKPQPVERRIPAVRVLVATPRTVKLEVRSQGNVEARTEIDLVPEVSGRVIAIDPSLVDGGRFDAGTVLLRIEPADFDLEVTERRAAVAQARMRVALEEAEAASAREQWRQMRPGENPSPLLLREPQLAHARAELAAAEAALERAELDRARCDLAAPFEGRVRTRAVDAGQYVVAGQPVARIYSVDVAEVRLSIPDEELAFLDLPARMHAEGATAGPDVTLSASFGGRRWEWTGRIDRTLGTIDTKTRQVVLIARVEQPQELSDQHERPPLAVGMFVHAAIEGRTVEGVVEIPRASVRDGDKVLVVGDGERLQIREVGILRGDRDRVLVTRGLAAGERVCTTLLEVVTDGMEVRVLADGEEQSR